MSYKLFAPKYYKDFKCIADKCTHSCCIGWEIDIDEETLEKYESLPRDAKDEILNGVSYEGTPHFKLCEKGRCFHLDENGLCKIIKSKGESFLCEICREHPRFYNSTKRGKEVGLGMACEEACRIILSSDLYGEMVEIGELPEMFCETEGEYADSFCEDEDFAINRDEIFRILLNDRFSYSEKTGEISKAFNVTLNVFSDEEWREVLSGLEYLDESHKTLFSCYSSNAVGDNWEKYLLRAFAYFVYRHCTDCFDEKEFLRSLGFALFCEKLFASVLIAKNPKSFVDVVEFARIISEEIEYSEENTEAIKLKFY